MQTKTFPVVFNPLNSSYVSFPFTHPYFYPNSIAFLTWFPAFSPLFPKSPPWFFALPTFQTDYRHLHTYSRHTQSDYLHYCPIPAILLTPFPNIPFRRSQMAAENDILTSLKTISTSWRSSHRSILQRKQFIQIFKICRRRISVLVTLQFYNQSFY